MWDVMFYWYVYGTYLWWWRTHIDADKTNDLSKNGGQAIVIYFFCFQRNSIIIVYQIFLNSFVVHLWHGLQKIVIFVITSNRFHKKKSTYAGYYHDYTFYIKWYFKIFERKHNVCDMKLWIRLVCKWIILLI